MLNAMSSKSILTTPTEPINKMESTKLYFEAGASEFDDDIHFLAPHYKQMLDALVVGLPFAKSLPIRVVDIGCGTGNVAQRVKESYPDAVITCVDISESMLRTSRSKLSHYSDIDYQLADIQNYEFEATYDVVVSSLALHHLASDEDKVGFYEKVHNALDLGGFFYNADIVLGSSLCLQEKYIRKWREYMHQQGIDKETERRWLGQHYNDDFPSILLNQLSWLQRLSFTEVDVLWKYYNFAVYGGRRPFS